MVIVEFFDRTPIENMIGAFANRPERVVLVGDCKKMKRQDSNYRRFLAATGNDVTQLEYRGVKVHQLHEIVRVLEGVVQDYPGCCFDLTGGDDLTMVAIGVVYERHREQGIEMHQYNIRTGTVYDCDLDGDVVDGQIPDMTVEQNVILHGGCIVSADQRESGTFQWDFNEEFVHDIEAMWRISSANPGIWNYQLTMLDKMQEFAFFSPDGLEMRVNNSTAAERHINTRSLYLYPDGVFCQLEREGLLTALENDDVHFYLCFKNEQVKRCLTKAGTILELKTYLIATSLTEQDGSARYNDVMTGVFIDWDGVVHERSESAVDTENEIDLVLMRGRVPVFVSCKNGAVGEAELYKLNTVASRFGGAYARKLLIGTTLGKSGRGKQYFLQRAKDMKIQVLDGVHTLSDEQFRKKLKAFA